MALFVNTNANIFLGKNVKVTLGLVEPTPGNFYFFLPTDSTTSAAVYDGNGKLLRNLWDVVVYPAGTVVEWWNQTGSDGNPVTGSYGIDYHIKVVNHTVTASWQGAMIGNTSTAFSGHLKLRSFNPMVSGVLVGKKFYVACSYAEGISSGKLINFDAKGLKALDILDPYNGMGLQEGENGQNSQFICSDGNIVWWTGFDPFSSNNSWTYGTYTRNNSEVEFISGSSYTCFIGREYEWSIGRKTNGINGYATGIAVNDTYVYISRGGVNSVDILNKISGQVITSSSFTNPRCVSINGNDLWMITGSAGSGSVIKCTLSASTITPVLALTGLTNPLNITTTQANYRYYYQTSASSISGYKSAETWIPFQTETSSSASVPSNNTEVLIEEFITDYVGITTIPSASWTFNTYAKTSNSLTSELVYRIFKRTAGGTETALFNITSSGGFSGTDTYQLKTTNTTQSFFSLNETDTIVVKVYGVKTAGGSSIITVAYDGSTRQSNFNISPVDNFVYVIDGGSSQQFKKFTTSGTPVWIQGVSGGMAVSPEVTSSNKFYFSDNATGLYDPSDNRRPFAFTMMDESYWVFDNGNERLRHFSSSREFIEDISWFPASYVVRGDENNPTRLWNQFCEYSASLEDPSDWQLVRNWRYYLDDEHFEQIIDTLNFPTQLSNGQTYAWLRRSDNSDYEMVRLDTGSGIEYLNIFTPELVKIWMNRNGDLYYLDIADYNQVGSTVILKKKTLTGFSGFTPTYTAWQTASVMPNIAANNGMGDAIYGNAEAPIITDSGKIVNYNITHTNINPHLTIFVSGSSTYEAKSMFPTYRGSGVDSWSYQDGYVGPYPETGYDIGNDVQYPGCAVYSANGIILVNYKGEFWQLSQTNKNHLYLENLMPLMTFGVTANVAQGLANDNQSPAMMAGNLFPGNIFVASGSDVIFYRTNDESNASAIHCWKISNISTISIQTASLGGTFIADSGIDIFRDLPYRDFVFTTGSITRSPNSEYNTGANSWGVCSGRKTYIDGENDVWCRFQSNTGLDAYVDFSFSSSVAVINDFTITGKVMFWGVMPWYSGVGSYIQILDDEDKIIADLHMLRDNTVEAIHRIQVNGNTIVSCSQLQTELYLTEWKNVSIRVHSGGCDFVFDGVELNNVSMVDPTADRLHPAKLRITCISNSDEDDFTLSSWISAKGFRYYNG